MAAQGAVKKAAAGPSNTPVAGVPRVPKGPKQPKRRQWDYTRYLQTIHKPEEFTEFAAGYPDKSGLCVYMYRLQPKIDFNLIGIRDAYIKKSADPSEWSPAWLGENFGRGMYMIKLNDANRPKGQCDVAKIVLDLNDGDKLPVYDLRTLKLTDPMNQDEISRLLQSGELVRDQNGAPRMRTAADGPAVPFMAAAAPVAAPSFGSEFMPKEIFGQVLLSLVQRGSQDPSKQISDILAVAKTLTPPPAPVAPVLNVEQIVEQVVARLGARPRADDMFTNYERLDSFITKARGPVAAVVNGAEAVAAAGGSPLAWIGSVGQILSEIRQIIPLLPALRAAGGETGPAPAGRGNVRVMPSPPPVPQQAMTPDQRIEEIARLGFEKMNEGVNGWDYAAWVCNFHPGGREVFTWLEPGGPAALLGLAAMNPATAPLVRDAAVRAQIETFLVDFFSFDATGASEAPPAAEGSGAVAPA